MSFGNWGLCLADERYVLLGGDCAEKSDSRYSLIGLKELKMR